MPKLDGTHLFSRLVIRLEQLEAGEEIAAKELRSLLTTKQLKELDDAWKKQQELRKGKRARTPEEEKALGWKTKREVRIKVFKDAIAAADENIELEFEKLQIKVCIPVNVTTDSGNMTSIPVNVTEGRCCAF